MRDRLAARVGAIVASDAGADCLAVVIANLLPGRLDMASFARIGRAGVLGGFAGRDRTIVTAGALPRRSLEAAADVTGGAVDAEVSPCKWKAGREVIEGSASLRLSSRAKQSRQHERHAQAPSP